MNENEQNGLKKKKYWNRDTHLVPSCCCAESSLDRSILRSIEYIFDRSTLYEANAKSIDRLNLFSIDRIFRAPSKLQNLQNRSGKNKERT